ncbi:hypothetical protein EQ500_10200 [Lactobacillus sp. XV13L]|nr:hypothetical protein [Lactobacillus sp. XV13L]
MRCKIMKIGFVGAGKIGQALIKGFLAAGINNQDIMVLKSHHQTAQTIAAQYQLQLADDYADLNFSDLVIVAVPARAFADVIDNLKTNYHGMIVSVSGGNLAAIKAQLPVDTSFVKAVPNTPVQLQQGITAISFAETETAANRS